MLGEAKMRLHSKVLLWNPTHGHARQGRPRKNYINQLAEEAGCLEEDLPSVMQDRDQWRDRVRRTRDINAPLLI